MIQTVNPRTTAEIMSRYRPIAPKPELPPPSGGEADGGGITCKSPYLRNVWPHLQARPTRTRKRTRSAAHFSPAKRQQHHRVAAAAATQNENGNGISLVPCRIDLNSTAAPQELDFLQQLQQPLRQPVIISPRPVRPVGSTVIVDNIITISEEQFMTEKEGIDDVEAMVEAEHAPAIISDVNNKVRMVNSAYKEMIGQPECGWLDCASLVPGSTCSGGKRIGGGVSLHFADSYQYMHIAGMHGFCCQVKIEWEESDGRNKTKKSVAASCKTERIECQVKNYHFLWRFQAIDSPDSDNWKSSLTAQGNHQF